MVAPRRRSPLRQLEQRLRSVVGAEAPGEPAAEEWEEAALRIVENERWWRELGAAFADPEIG